MKVLALIPARGGSVRIPRKNLARLAGRSLIGWAILHATRAKSITPANLIVSTDDPEIYHEAKYYGISTIERPKELAHSEAPMLPVVRHALEKHPADVVILLQPTSPFRTHEDIDKAMELFEHTKADAVVSVTEAPDEYVFEIGHAGRMRSAHNIVVPNGAVYIISAEALARGHNWYSGITSAYRMPRDRSLDIDTPVDLAMARAIAEKRNEAA